MLVGTLSVNCVCSHSSGDCGCNVSLSSIVSFKFPDGFPAVFMNGIVNCIKSAK